MTKKRWVLASVAAVIVVAAVGLWASQHVPPSPTGYSTVAEDVSFYPACGAGPIVYAGDTWYPISRDDWPTPIANAAAASGGRGVALGAHMVSAPPGPGDDIGTLYIYPHGIAYWVSESGLDTWFTLLPQSYNYVC